MKREDLGARISRGLQFLAREQAPSPVAQAGAWPAQMHARGGDRVDWNCFTTCWVCDCLEELSRSCGDSAKCDQISQLQNRARSYLRTCAAESPPGAFRFWGRGDTYRAVADLDDTALAHLSLGNAALSSTEALALFGPYRATRGRPLHPTSQWASGYAGVFTVWMDDGPAIIDACACANVVRYLCQAGVRDVPGYKASLKMLADLLTTRESLVGCTPYYCSPQATAFLCSRFRPPAIGEMSEERALLWAVRSWVELSDTRLELRELDRMLLVSARLAMGMTPETELVKQLCQSQNADGGWPAGAICQGLLGEPQWSSRAVATALACEILVRFERSNDPPC